MSWAGWFLNSISLLPAKVVRTLRVCSAPRDRKRRPVSQHLTEDPSLDVTLCFRSRALALPWTTPTPRPRLPQPAPVFSPGARPPAVPGIHTSLAGSSTPPAPSRRCGLESVLMMVIVLFMEPLRPCQAPRLVLPTHYTIYWPQRPCQVRVLMHNSETS